MTTALPNWFQARQEAALKRFEETPTPKRGDEAWRFSNIKQLQFSNLSGKIASVKSQEIVALSKGAEKPAAKFIFLNDELIHSESSLPKEIICLPLRDALVAHSELVETYFMQQEPRLGSAKYAALHESAVKNGVFIFVPDHVKIDSLIEIHHWVSGETTTFPHTLIISGKSSSVKVMEVFSSCDTTTPALIISCNDLHAGENSDLSYVATQELNETTRIIIMNQTTTEQNARAKTFLLNTGASWARCEAFSYLKGAGSRSEMLSVSLPAHEQEYDLRTFQHHHAEGTSSDLLYKNTLYGHSKTVFSGLIYVHEGAHHTDAFQSCRNLLMTDDCEANSMPGLEINADQVKCSHGSTSARISDEEIFYLCARGISPKQACQLIAKGFSIQVVQRLNHEETEAIILQKMDKKFSEISD